MTAHRDALNGLVWVVAVLACACSSDDPGEPQCGTPTNPDPLVVVGVEPAPGSEVPNASIVHRFTVTGFDALLQPALGLPAAHTAGTSTPDALTWTASTVGSDTTYSATPLSWATAPAHVELQPTRIFELDGCYYALPSPLFSYDVTAP